MIERHVKLAGELNEVLGQLTLEYCATECFNPPEGCCFRNFHRKNAIPELSRLQGQEALANGWEEGNRCTYHTSEGCLLNTKSPYCLGHLCDDLVDDLGRSYGLKQSESFVSAMRRVKHGSFQNTDLLFTAIEEAISEGRRLTLV
tara:strand:+ start:275 stop:709 length:435 start_codon:yes stop_codon:yes gene_type:complete